MNSHELMVLIASVVVFVVVIGLIYWLFCHEQYHDEFKRTKRDKPNQAGKATTLSGSDKEFLFSRPIDHQKIKPVRSQQATRRFSVGSQIRSSHHHHNDNQFLTGMMVGSAMSDTSHTSCHEPDTRTIDNYSSCSNDSYIKRTTGTEWRA